MRVLFVLENYFPFVGGAETLFQHVCEGLAEKGHTVTVVTSSQPGAPAFEVLNSVTIHRVKCPHRGSRYWFTFLAIPWLVINALICLFVSRAMLRKVA